VLVHLGNAYLVGGLMLVAVGVLLVCGILRHWESRTAGQRSLSLSLAFYFLQRGLETVDESDGTRDVVARAAGDPWLYVLSVALLLVGTLAYVIEPKPDPCARCVREEE
jgi:hypothetical protein